MAGLDGTISPGMSVRDINGGAGATTDWQPVVNATLYGRGHSLRFSYNGILQQPQAVTGFDTLTQRLALQYNYRYKKHRFGVEANYYDRDPEGLATTQATRFMVFWEYQYDKPPRPLCAQRPGAATWPRCRCRSTRLRARRVSRHGRVGSAGSGPG
ncbi:MAG: hypothetical protein U5P41_11210 [Gammaproteobacteria bacterium]|nr:hypothetical protein [Gammaproteobacteria bacterium]